MDPKQPSQSKPVPHPSTEGADQLSEQDKKKMELGDAMEHEHGQERESTEEDIEKIDGGSKKRQ